MIISVNIPYMDLMGTDDSNVCGSSSAKGARNFQKPVLGGPPLGGVECLLFFTTWWLNLNPFENTGSRHIGSFPPREVNKNQLIHGHLAWIAHHMGCKAPCK